MKKTLVYSDLTKIIYEFSEYDIRAALLSQVEFSGFDLENYTFEFLYGENNCLTGAKIVIRREVEKK